MDLEERTMHHAGGSRNFNPIHWTILTTAGLAGGLAAGAAAGIPLGRLLNAMAAIAVMTVVIGAVLGAFQAAGLRRLLAKPAWWIAATVAGVAAGLALGVMLVQEIGIRLTGSPLQIAQLGTAMRALSFVAVGLVAGTVLGAAQWLVLRAQRQDVKQWVVVCGAALAIAFCVASLLVDASGMRYASGIGRFSFLLLAGGLFGALTSLPLRRVAPSR
jgi:hypothetical protein